MVFSISEFKGVKIIQKIDGLHTSLSFKFEQFKKKIFFVPFLHLPLNQRESGKIINGFEITRDRIFNYCAKQQVSSSFFSSTTELHLPFLRWSIQHLYQNNLQFWSKVNVKLFSSKISLSKLLLNDTGSMTFFFKIFLFYIFPWSRSLEK